jgi:hypothetical protein
MSILGQVGHISGTEGRNRPTGVDFTGGCRVSKKVFGKKHRAVVLLIEICGHELITSQKVFKLTHTRAL